MLNCYYCGVELTYATATVDHKNPRRHGGSNKKRNKVTACGVCNSIKGARTIDEARPNLVQKMIGWPKFNAVQLTWLRSNGLDMGDFDRAKLGSGSV